jgi:hypothetical protein
MFRTLNLAEDGNLDYDSTSVKKLNNITFRHFMDMFYPAWEHGFTVERNTLGWKKEGIIPFTRAQLNKHRHLLASRSLLSSGGSN